MSKELTIDDIFDGKCAKVGTGECYATMVLHPENKLVLVDKCLIPEITYLNLNGIKTIGCCCGHPKDKERGGSGFIQVTPNDVPRMKKLGYESIKGYGQWCYLPKTDVLDVIKEY